jgi:uncharacterized repeat protein (TIGR01451 family)
LVWHSQGWESPIYHKVREPDGSWSEATLVVPDAATEEEQAFALQMAEDGTLHLVYRTRGLTNIYYLRKAPADPWSSPEPVFSHPAEVPVSMPDLALGPDNALHLVWAENQREQIRYAYRPPGGSWAVRSTPLAQGSEPAEIAVTPDRTIHVIWHPASGPALRYLFKRPGGPWQEGPPPLPGELPMVKADLLVSPTGSVVLAYAAPGSPTSGWWDVWLRELLPNGTWGPPRGVSQSPNGAFDPLFVYDDAGGLHFLTRESAIPGWGVYILLYAYRPPGRTGWPLRWRVRMEPTWSDAVPALAWTPSGVHFAWMDSARSLHYSGPIRLPDVAGDSAISRTFALSGLYQPTLAFHYIVDTLAGTADRFEVTVDDGTRRSQIFSAAEATSDWTFTWADLSPWAGQTVTVTFSLTSVADYVPTTVLLDEVSLGSAYPDLWAETVPKVWGAPGAVLAYRLAYGNRGSVPSVGAVLTHTLPAGLTFVGAEPAPSLVDGSLVWALGDLASGASGEVQVAVALPPDAAPGIPFTATVRIGSAAPEAHLANNEREVAFQAAYRHPLPLLLRESR